MASSIFQLLLQNPFLSNHSIHAFQEGCVLGAPCMSSPISGQGWSYPCQLELATLVLTAPGRCCTQEACTHRVSERNGLAWGPEGRSRWTGRGILEGGRSIFLACLKLTPHALVLGQPALPWCGQGECSLFCPSPRLRRWFPLWPRCGGGLPPASAETPCRRLPAQ